jgi:hypothetical protein
LIKFIFSFFRGREMAASVGTSFIISEKSAFSKVVPRPPTPRPSDEIARLEREADISTISRRSLSSHAGSKRSLSPTAHPAPSVLLSQQLSQHEPDSKRQRILNPKERGSHLTPEIIRRLIEKAKADWARQRILDAEKAARSKFSER